MKKKILSAIGIIAGILFGTTLSLSAQEKLSLKQCREMALKYNKGNGCCRPARQKQRG